MIICDINNYMWFIEFLMIDVIDVIIVRFMVY